MFYSRYFYTISFCNVVHNLVEHTLLKLAGIKLFSFKSTLLNTIPLSASPGKILTFDFLPV